MKVPIPSCGILADNRADSENWECLGQIVGPTPISMRKHCEDGLVGELQLYAHAKYDASLGVLLSVPIKYCPFCGKEIEL